MPSVTKITKDMILDTAFLITKESGFDAVSNREIAKRLNCSIRPIYYQFKNTEELKQELYNKIERYFYKFAFCDLNDDIPKYKQVGIKYVEFARKEKNLFKLLFMSDSSYFMKDFISRDKEDYTMLTNFIRESTNLKEGDVNKFHLLMWIFTHGISTLVACGTVKFSDEDIFDMLSYQFQAMMLLKENPNNKWVFKNYKKEDGNNEEK